MKDLPPDISQEGLRPLLKERFENPEAYAERPLILWRSYFYDGVSYDLVREVEAEYNQGRAKMYRKVVLRANPVQTKRANLGFCAIDTLEDYRRTLRNYPGMPMVVYACLPEPEESLREEFPDAEEYMFAPDFKQWKDAHAEFDNFRLVAEFVEEGAHTPEDVTYRWYNYFRNDHISRRKGCDFPDKWLLGLCKLRMYRKLLSVAGKDEAAPDKFRSFFAPGISSDLIDEFRAFIDKRESL